MHARPWLLGGSLASCCLGSWVHMWCPPSGCGCSRWALFQSERGRLLCLGLLCQIFWYPLLLHWFFGFCLLFVCFLDGVSLLSHRLPPLPRAGTNVSGSGCDLRMGKSLNPHQDHLPPRLLQMLNPSQGQEARMTPRLIPIKSLAPPSYGAEGELQPKPQMLTL